MTTIDLQTYLDPELYALFAKASYCKTRNDIATTAIVAMHDWLDYKYSNWGVIAENQGINGFQAVAYGKDINKDGIYEEVVIAYRGTDSFLDLFGDDLLIALNITPTQSIGAKNFYDQIIANTNMTPDAKVSVTGHSLGGALAQIVGAEKDVAAITFNAPGMLNHVDKSKNYDKITNYVNLNDWVGCYGEHIGSTKYYLPDGIVNNTFSPHSDYIYDDYDRYNIDINESEWKVDYAASLWGYDENNTDVNFQQLIASNKATPENLEKAVEIIQKIYGKTNKLDSSFHYVTPTGINYFIGGTNSESGGNSNDDQIQLKNGLHLKENIAWGNAGNDTIIGATKKDILIGGNGLDVLKGGDGNDVLIAGNANSDKISEIKDIYGKRTDIEVDNYQADNSENILYGGVGSDLLIGDKGNDKLYAGSSIDYLYGGQGNDELYNYQDTAYLYGGKGHDTYFITSSSTNII